MGKMPIPGLDNLNIKTYAVCWYDSDAWEAILAGFVSTVVVPDFWDDTTGDLDNVLEAADVLMDANDGLALREVDMGCLQILTGSKLSASVPQTVSGAGTYDEIIVPDGEVWDVFGVSMRVLGGSATSFELMAVGGYPRFPRFIIASSPYQAIEQSNTRVRLTEGDIVRISITGGTLEYGYTVYGWKYTV